MNQSVIKNGLIYGVVAGLFWSACTFLAWVSGIKVMVSFQWIGTFLPIIFLIFLLGAFNLRKKQSNILPFKNALQFAFVGYVVYELINAVTVYILFNLIDPTLTEQILEKSLEKIQTFMESKGVPSSEIESAMEKATKEKPKTSLREIFVGLGFSLIWNFVKSLIIAAIAKKEPQPSFESDNLS